MGQRIFQMMKLYRAASSKAARDLQEPRQLAERDLQADLCERRVCVPPFDIVFDAKGKNVALADAGQLDLTGQPVVDLAECGGLPADTLEHGGIAEEGNRQPGLTFPFDAEATIIRAEGSVCAMRSTVVVLPIPASPVIKTGIFQLTPHPIVSPICWAIGVSMKRLRSEAPVMPFCP